MYLSFLFIVCMCVSLGGKAEFGEAAEGHCEVRMEGRRLPGPVTRELARRVVAAIEAELPVPRFAQLHDDLGGRKIRWVAVEYPVEHNMSRINKNDDWHGLLRRAGAENEASPAAAENVEEVHDDDDEEEEEEEGDGEEEEGLSATRETDGNEEEKGEPSSSLREVTTLVQEQLTTRNGKIRILAWKDDDDMDRTDELSALMQRSLHVAGDDGGRGRERRHPDRYRRARSPSPPPPPRDPNELPTSFVGR